MRSKEMFDSLGILEKEKGIPMSFVFNKISKAIATACRNNYDGNEDVTINVDEKKNTFEVYLKKTVVETVEKPGHEISFEDAVKIDPNVQLGEKVDIKLNTKDFGRIAVQTARTILKQGIRDGETDVILKNFESKKGETVNAIVEKIDPKTKNVSLRIGNVEAVLPKTEQLPTDVFKEGSIIKVYVVDAKEGTKGAKIMVSRVHVNAIKQLFKNEIPEVEDGIVEIMAVAREPGRRSKLAVVTHNPDVDPIGACIGPKGIRINSIIEELGGEKLDIVEYSDDISEFITNSLLPATVTKVEIINEESRICEAIVPEHELSLAIGAGGINAKLASKLTDWRINVKSEEPN